MAAPLSPSLLNSLAAAVTAVVVLSGDVLTAQQDRSAVSARLMVSARSEPATFARALARSNIRAGFVLPVDAQETPDQPPSMTSASGVIPIDLALDEFKKAHPDFTVSRANDSIMIRPRVATACDEVLDAPVGPIQIEGSLSAVAALLAHAVNPRLPIPATSGQIGSAISAPAEPFALPAPVRVVANIPQTSFKNALNYLSSAAPGTVWLLEERRWNMGPVGCELRLMRSDGSALSVAGNLIER